MKSDLYMRSDLNPLIYVKMKYEDNEKMSTKFYILILCKYKILHKLCKYKIEYYK